MGGVRSSIRRVVKTLKTANASPMNITLLLSLSFAVRRDGALFFLSFPAAVAAVLSCPAITTTTAAVHVHGCRAETGQAIEGEREAGIMARMREL